MRLLSFSYAPPHDKFGASVRTGRSPGRRRLVRLNRANRLRHLCKQLLMVALKDGWLKSVPVERPEDTFWLLSL